MYTTIRPKLLGSSFIYLFHLYTTTRPKSGSFLLFNLFTYNCANILYATFMAVLIYSVHCIHGGTALIFRTRCPWLYEVLSWFPGIAGNDGNHGNDRKFQKSYQILNQTKRYINKLCFGKISRYKTVSTILALIIGKVNFKLQ